VGGRFGDRWGGGHERVSDDYEGPWSGGSESPWSDDHTFFERARLSGDMAITLYSLDGCPWCEKVHDALDAEGIDYETNWVDPLHSDRNEVKRVSGQRGVPVLVDTERGVTMAESAKILEYVERSLQ